MNIVHKASCGGISYLCNAKKTSGIALIEPISFPKNAIGPSKIIMRRILVRSLARVIWGAVEAPIIVIVLACAIKNTQDMIYKTITTEFDLNAAPT
jgi:hypothetical protein